MKDVFSRVQSVRTSYFRILSVMGLLLSNLLGAHATPGAFEARLHGYFAYKICVINGHHPTEVVNVLAAHPKKYHIVMWQVSPEDTREEDVKRLMDWVNQGGVLWFQDSRLAAQFGMRAAPISARDLPELHLRKEDYGGKSVEGAVLIAVAPEGASHPVLTQVDTVQVFLMPVGDRQFSAIQKGDDVQPLLVVGQGAVPDRVIAGLKSVGKGTVVFKPQIWTDILTGLRLQGNLLEWSAGYQVPPAETR